MDAVAFIVPREYQTRVLWLPAHFLAALWLGWTFYGVLYSGEIPIRRPMGLRGYQYMNFVTMLQIAVNGAMVFNLELARDLIFQVIPGAYADQWRKPGFLVGAALYFDLLNSAQAIPDLPEGQEAPTVPYKITFDALLSVIIIIFIIRHVKLNKLLDEIQRRIDMPGMVDFA